MKRLLFSVIALIALTFDTSCNSRPPATSDATTVDQVVATRETPVAATEDSPSVAPEPATEPMEGFVLIAPLRSTETYLMNAAKQVVHRWKSDYPPISVYLMDNGDLLRCARDPEFTHFSGGGIGGVLERYNWNGQLVWSFRYANEDLCSHHDIAPLPNGNILMIAWERKSKEEAIAQGRDPARLKDDLWPDHVIEVQPDGPTNGKVVWEWHMWDHLVQDFDRDKPNYGVIYEHPELIDLNNTGSTPPATPEELRTLRAVGYAGGGDDKDISDRRIGSDWLHTNAIDYNPTLDQIALSAKNFSEIWIIDHSTTTEEAASHRGGKSGKGGDLLYRWGNPWSYKSGTANEKMLFDQHDVRWIPPGVPGAGHITAFNNGPGREYSSIIEIETPIDSDGGYSLDDEGRFGPYQFAWEYTAENKKDFYSSFISGATRLPNGSTFICEGATGRYFEVNSEGKTLWEHVNTFGGEIDSDGHPNEVEAEARKLLEGGGERSVVENNALFRATKYSPAYAAFTGKTLEPLVQQPVPFSDLVDAAVARLKAESAANTDAEQPAAEEVQKEDEQVELPKARAEGIEGTQPEADSDSGN
jgi:hypothetical protein